MAYQGGNDKLESSIRDLTKVMEGSNQEQLIRAIRNLSSDMLSLSTKMASLQFGGSNKGSSVSLVGLDTVNGTLETLVDAFDSLATVVSGIHTLVSSISTATTAIQDLTVVVNKMGVYEQMVNDKGTHQMIADLSGKIDELVEFIKG